MDQNQGGLDQSVWDRFMVNSSWPMMDQGYEVAWAIHQIPVPADPTWPIVVLIKS